MNVLAKNVPWKAYQTTISKSREHQSLNKVFKAGNNDEFLLCHIIQLYDRISIWVH